jgi:predicted alpha/beta superfamily hydrolase
LAKLIWNNYTDLFPVEDGYRVAGNIQVTQGFYSPQLDNERDILVYLPPSYDDGDGRYPVLYMQDGQNLFDHLTSFSGEWYADDTAETLAREEGLELIIVAIPNMGDKRLDEYSPFVGRDGGGKGDAYLDFLTSTLKPMIDDQFRTRPEPETTGIMGSSMGGLISLYGFFARGDVFGFGGVMSPSLWFANQAIYSYIKQTPSTGGNLYLDAGTREEGGSLSHPVRLMRSRRYYAGVRRLKRILVEKDYRPTVNLMHVEEKYAGHSESAWARRFPGAIRFFLNGRS